MRSVSHDWMIRAWPPAQSVRLTAARRGTRLHVVDKRLHWMHSTTRRWDGYLEFQRHPDPMLDWFAKHNELNGMVAGLRCRPQP